MHQSDSCENCQRVEYITEIFGTCSSCQVIGSYDDSYPFMKTNNVFWHHHIPVSDIESLLVIVDVFKLGIFFVSKKSITKQPNVCGNAQQFFAHRWTDWAGNNMVASWNDRVCKVMPTGDFVSTFPSPLYIHISESDKPWSFIVVNPCCWLVFTNAGLLVALCWLIHETLVKQLTLNICHINNMLRYTNAKD